MSPVLDVAAPAALAVLVAWSTLRALVLLALTATAATTLGRSRAWPAEATRQLTFGNPLAPGVTFVVPVQSDERGLVATVTSLLDLGYPHVQVVVVDSSPGAAVSQALRRALDLQAQAPDRPALTPAYRSGRHPRLELVCAEPGSGAGAALGVGLRAARHDLVARVDPGCVLDPDAVLRLVQPLLHREDVAAVTALVAPTTGPGARRPWATRLEALTSLRLFLPARLGGVLLLGRIDGPTTVTLLRRGPLAALAGGARATSDVPESELLLRLLDAEPGHRLVALPEPVGRGPAPSSWSVPTRRRREQSRALLRLLGPALRPGAHRLRGARGPGLAVSAVPLALRRVAALVLAPALLAVVGAGLLAGSLAAGAVVGWGVVVLLQAVAVSLACLLLHEAAGPPSRRVLDLALLVVAAVVEPLLVAVRGLTAGRPSLPGRRTAPPATLQERRRVGDRPGVRV